MDDVGPKVPKTLDPIAREVLDRLRGTDVARSLILGGGVALAHYADFRPTHDVDAWWVGSASPEAISAIAGIVRGLAEDRGLSFRQRSWNEAVSLEMFDATAAGEPTRFAVQIATRDIQLEPPVVSAWPPLLIETLADNVGAKMNALVRRGAPRDIIDIYEVVDRGLVTIDDCWSLWERKNPGLAIADAKRAVVRNIAELAARRPAGTLPAVEREIAAKRREFFSAEFVR